jgi:hypothetical protein
MTTRTLVATPDPPGGGRLSHKQLVQLSRRRTRAEIQLVEVQLDLDILVTIDEMKTEALGDVLDFALEEECRMVDRIRVAAQGDPVKIELGAQKLELFASNNLVRARRLGRSL